MESVLDRTVRFLIQTSKREFTRMIRLLWLGLITAQKTYDDVEKPDGLQATDLMYIECKLTRMCAFLSESWLETQVKLF